MPDSQGAEASALAVLYRGRFHGADADRSRVWQVLTGRVFQPLVPKEGSVLDVGSGYAEFINQIEARRRYAIDLNPDAKARVHPEVQFFAQSCADRWPLEDGALDVVFTSNFLEHLPNKDAVVATVKEARRCLKAGGRIICLGPNIRFLAGEYWDFFDHLVPLSDRSMVECLAAQGFEVERVVPRFLPYTMSGKKPPPSAFIKLYLAMPWVWPLFGRQFLVVAKKP
jgi:SAM-dependent methyltransferase